MAEKEFMSLGFEATELRLGLPGDSNHGVKSGHHVDLKLMLPTAAMEEVKVIKRSGDHCPEKPSAAKAQAVGWPPVRSFRRNIMTSTQNEKAKKEEPDNDHKSTINSNKTAAFVKVSMDGAPYLRKVDLKMYRSYHELSLALEKMFSSFTSGNCDSQEINFMNESKLMDLLNGSDYVPTYQDKDGDWMLVGDVPWEMFVDSCKRLRIMKGSEAIGIAPKTMEKCKSRS